MIGLASEKGIVEEASSEGQFAAVLERVEGWFKVTAEGYQTLTQRIDRMEQRLDGRIDDLDRKIDLVARTLIQRMDERFAKIDERFVQMNQRLLTMSHDLHALNGRFDTHERRHTV